MSSTPPSSTSEFTVPAGIGPRQRLTDGAYNAIKQMIISNEMKGGQVISVVGLAESLGVSRSPVKQAVIGLEQDGFIESEPFKAPRVARITSRSIHNVYGVRTALEAQAASDATSNLEDEELVDLAASFAALPKVLDSSNVAAVAEFDTRLHRLFIARAGNDLLSTFLGNLEHHLLRIRNVYGRHIYTRSEFASQREELGRIVDAAVRRDKAAVELAMKVHVMSHAERLIAKVDADE
jgi:DNA-binding GntR family transcriptional regulator